MVLAQLLDAGFQVTALTRQGGSQTFPSNVTVKAVDYDSLDSLTSALQGQDAVVATLGSFALDKQFLLIDAAAKAGVKRFIPSEFGSNTLHERTSKLPGYKLKVDVRKALEKAASESGLTWTVVVNGPFLDWGISAGFLLNAKDRTIELPDGGNNKFSASTLSTVAKGVVGVLKNPDQTKNRGVYVQDAVLTLKQLEGIVQKLVGADGWKETVPSIEEGLQQGLEEIKKEQPNMLTVFLTTLKAAIYGGDAYGCQFHKNDNELFGIKELSDAEVEAVVAKSIPK